MEEKTVPKVLYLRSGPYELNFNSYNLQEVGLGKAFCNAGYDFDIVYYSKNKNREQVIEVPENHLRILWRKGIKLLRSGVYPQILNKKFLNDYDIVIVSEYSQIMSVLLSKRHDNVFVYNGPYYNLFKIAFMEPIYDFLFCKNLNKRLRKTFCKTQMSKDYIAQKGITNSTVVGVGLDTAKFDEELSIKSETQILLNKMSGHRNLLYIGSIITRKNVELLIKAFVETKKHSNTEDVQLVLVGKGDKSYTEHCQSLVPEYLKNDVIWCEFVENAQTKFVYQAATAFMLPSIQEIFGMVLLEAMYFETPVISSHSAGAGTLIKSGENGIIVEEFDEHKWAQAILSLLEEPEKTKQLGKEASATIRNEFMWDGIAKKMLKEIEHE